MTLITNIFIIFISLLFIPITYYTLTLIFSKKDYHNYIKDNLFGSQNIWYWSWEKENIDILFSKCSKCNTILQYDENLTNNMVYYFCPKCHSQEMSMKSHSHIYSQFLLKREIKRRLFGDNYKKFHN